MEFTGRLKAAGWVGPAATGLLVGVVVAGCLAAALLARPAAGGGEVTPGGPGE